MDTVDNSRGRARLGRQRGGHRRATLALASRRALLRPIPVVRVLAGMVVALEVGLLTPVEALL